MKLPLLFFLLPLCSVAQTMVNGHLFPQQQVNEALQKAWEQKDNAQPGNGAYHETGGAYHSGIIAATGRRNENSPIINA